MTSPDYLSLMPKFLSWRHLVTHGTLADLEQALMLGQNVNGPLDNESRYPPSVTALFHVASWSSYFTFDAVPKIQLLVQHKSDVNTAINGLKLSHLCRHNATVHHLLTQLENDGHV